MEEEATETGRNHGEQPLDELMKRWHLTNHDLVEISPEQLTHKQVQKARQGRQLTLKMMQHLVALLSIIYCKKHLRCRFWFVGVWITVGIPGFVLFYCFGIQIR